MGYMKCMGWKNINRATIESQATPGRKEVKLRTATASGTWHRMK
jgi:hypothetical protein